MNMATVVCSVCWTNLLLKPRKQKFVLFFVNDTESLLGFKSDDIESLLRSKNHDNESVVRLKTTIPNLSNVKYQTKIAMPTKVS